MNQREIKFRQWDEGLKSFQFFELCGLTMFISEGFNHHLESAIEQYTGMEDKNGIEIYEGDIIELKFSDSDEGYVSYISYWDQGASFVWGFQTICIFDDIEVIGSISENPEFLTP